MPPATSSFNPFQNDYCLACAVRIPSAARVEMNSLFFSGDHTCRKTRPPAQGKYFFRSTHPTPSGAESAYRWQHRYQRVPRRRRDAETLIKNADTAMYHAKDRGRNNFQFFKTEMNRKAVERQSLEGETAPRSGAKRVLVALSAEGKSRHR